MISKTWPAELMRALQQVERDMPHATTAEKADLLNRIQNVRQVTPGQLKNKIQTLDGKKGDRAGVAGWREMKIDPAGPGLFDDAAAPPAEPTPNRRLQPVEVQADMQDYEVIGDEIVFAFEKKVVRVSIERMDAICADYSAHGGDLTQAELARAHGLPLPVMRRILSAYGHYKSSAPYTRETVAQYAARDDLDALAERAVEVQEKALLRKIEQQRVTRDRARLRELESEDYRRRQIFDAAVEAASRIAILPPRPLSLGTGEGWHAHLPSTDEHAGKGARAGTVYGPGYSTVEMGRRLRAHAEFAAEWIRSERGRCLTIRRTFLGDIFEAFKGTTVSGTHLKTDMSDPDMWEVVLDSVLYSINALRGLAERVIVYMVPGNHDGALVHMLAATVQRVLAAQGVTDVEVRCHRMPYDYFRIGHAVHMLDHGQGYGALSAHKAKVSAEVNAREIAGDDYDGARSIYTYVGHLHESQIAVVGKHHELMRLPAFCETNDYETGLRFPGKGEARLFRLNLNGDILREERLRFAELPADAGLKAAA